MTMLRLPPPNILTRPARIDAWYFRLTPSERGVFKNYMMALIDQLPPQKKIEFNQKFNRLQGSIVQGLGWVGAVTTAVGSLVSAGVQVGASIYMSREQQEMQAQLASQAGMFDILGQSIMADTEKQVQQILADAQIEAARTAAGAQIGTAKEMARATIDQALIEARRDVQISQQQQVTKVQIAESTWGQWGKWGTISGLGLVGLVVVVGVARKMKKRKKAAI